MEGRGRKGPLRASDTTSTNSAPVTGSSVEYTSATARSAVSSCSCGTAVSCSPCTSCRVDSSAVIRGWSGERPFHRACERPRGGVAAAVVAHLVQVDPREPVAELRVAGQPLERVLPVLDLRVAREQQGQAAHLEEQDDARVVERVVEVAHQPGRGVRPLVGEPVDQPADRTGLEHDGSPVRRPRLPIPPRAARRPAPSASTPGGSPAVSRPAGPGRRWAGRAPSPRAPGSRRRCRHPSPRTGIARDRRARAHRAAPRHPRS